METLAAFAMGEANRNREMRVFDWDKAARIIRDEKPKLAEAGLAQDWNWTGGSIHEGGEIVPRDRTYTYLASTWATPVIRLGEDDERSCYRMESEVPGWDANTYWPESAVSILEGK